MLKRPTAPPKSAVVPVPPSMLPAAVAAGLGAVVLLPLDRPGLGWVLTGLAVVAAVVYSDRRSRPADAPRHFTRMSPVWAAAALALLAAGFVRASEWLFVLCVIAACVTGSLAVVGRRTAQLRVLRGVRRADRGAAFPAVARACGQAAGRGRRQRGAAADRRVRTGVGGAARRVRPAVERRGRDVRAPGVVAGPRPGRRTRSAWWLVAFGVAGFGVVGACYLLAAPPPPADEDAAARRLTHRVEWALPLGVLVALFAVFVAVRLVVLFGGDEYMRRTGGLTAADYARGGFWQLCAVTVLTLALVGAALRWAPNSTRGGPGLAARAARRAERAQPGAGRVGVESHVDIPAGVRVHRAAAAGRGVRALAGRGVRAGAGVAGAAAPGLAAPRGGGRRGRRPAGTGGARPRTVHRGPQHRPRRARARPSTSGT